VIDTELITSIIASTSEGVRIATVALVVVGAVMHFVGRRPGTRWLAAIAFAFGIQVGIGILVFDPLPLLRAAALAFVGAVAIALLWRDRRIAAGAFVAGSALPWTALWGYYVTLLARDDMNIEPIATWTFFGFGLVPTLIGLGLVLVGDPLPAEPDRTAAPGRPGSRRVGSVAHAISSAEAIGPTTVTALASFVTAFLAVELVGALGLPDPIGLAAQTGVGGIAATAAWFIARPPGARKAFEALSWMAEWEIARAKSITGRGFPLIRRNADGWLKAVPDQPETRWIRSELLTWLDRLDEARAVALAMPVGSPYQRFERAHALESIEWRAGAEADVDAVRAVAAEVGPIEDEMRLRAEVAIAVRESSRLAAEAGPVAALEPMLRARELLGPRADGFLVRALWWRHFVLMAALSAAIAVFPRVLSLIG